MDTMRRAMLKIQAKAALQGAASGAAGEQLPVLPEDADPNDEATLLKRLDAKVGRVAASVERMGTDMQRLAAKLDAALGHAATAPGGVIHVPETLAQVEVLSDVK